MGACLWTRGRRNGQTSLPQRTRVPELGHRGAQGGTLRAGAERGRWAAPGSLLEASASGGRLRAGSASAPRPAGPGSTRTSGASVLGAVPACGSACAASPGPGAALLAEPGALCHVRGVRDHFVLQLRKCSFLSVTLRPRPLVCLCACHPAVLVPTEGERDPRVRPEGGNPGAPGPPSMCFENSPTRSCIAGVTVVAEGPAGAQARPQTCVPRGEEAPT